MNPQDFIKGFTYQESCKLKFMVIKDRQEECMSKLH